MASLRCRGMCGAGTPASLPGATHLWRIFPDGRPDPGGPFLASFARSGDLGGGTIPTRALHVLQILFYADTNLGFGFTQTTMQGWTARFLLLFALAGTFVPLALAATAAPPHACCLRKAPHQCHGSDADQRSVRSTACCNHDCCRAVTTSQCAHPQPSLASAGAHFVASRIAESPASVPATERFASQSTRAPPQISLA